MRPRSSPRLPLNILKMIVDEVDDWPALRQCCLASSCLLPFARRILFMHVILSIGPEADRHGGNNLDEMLECYSTTTHAQYARTLSIRYHGRRNKASYSLCDYPKLWEIIDRLSTYSLDLRSGTRPPTVSKIDFVCFDNVSGSTWAFIRILRSFPAIDYLRWNVKEFTVSTERELRDCRQFLSSAPPAPQLDCLEVAFAKSRSKAREVLRVLFPPESKPCFSLLSLYRCGGPELWSSLLQRAGTSVETFETYEMPVDASDSEQFLSLPCCSPPLTCRPARTNGFTREHPFARCRSRLALTSRGRIIEFRHPDFAHADFPPPDAGFARRVQCQRRGCRSRGYVDFGASSPPGTEWKHT